MAGHSKWSTIKRQKESTDAKRGAVFTKIGNQIAIAARAGTDPATNSALALVIEKAKTANMPSANIQRAIDRIKDKNAAALEEVLYEAYGPGGVGILIEAATDNKNRTYPEVRTALVKNGGTMAEPGSVSFQFARKGVIEVSASGEDALMTVLEAGADDAMEEEDSLVVYTDAKQLAKVRQSIKDAGLAVLSAELMYVPSNMVDVSDEEVASKIIKITDALDELDDVSGVHSNFNIIS